MAGNGWTYIRLGDVCDKVGSGATPRGGASVYLDTGEITLIRSQNVYNDGFKHDGLVSITKKHGDELRNVEVQSDDVLLNITGDSVARCCQVDPSIIPARVNQHVAIIRPNSDYLDAQYLRYFLVSPQMQEMMLSWAGAGGTRNALTKEMIQSFEVAAPESVEEQRAIAQILGTLDDKIELNWRMTKTLEAIVSAMFKSWFIDFDPVRAKVDGRQPAGMDEGAAALFPDSFEDSELGDVPCGWVVRSLREVLVAENNRVGDANVPEYSSTNDGLQLRSERFKKKLSVSNSKNKLIHEGDLVFGLSRRVMNFGLMRDPVGCVSSAYKVFTINKDEVIPDLLERMMRMRPNYYYKAVSASSREGQSISSEGLGRLRFLQPNTSIQNAFYAATQALVSRADNATRESSVLADVRDTLLPRLISGEIRVKDAEKSVKENAG